jgi:hypothetical protein
MKNLYLVAVLAAAAGQMGAEEPFPVVARVDASTIAGRPVQLVSDRL